jgi:hypothetical protein
LEPDQLQIKREPIRPHTNTILNELNQFIRFTNQFTIIKEETNYIIKYPTKADDEDSRHRPKHPNLTKFIRLWNLLINLRNFGKSIKRKKRRKHSYNSHSGEDKIRKDLNKEEFNQRQFQMA